LAVNRKLDFAPSRAILPALVNGDTMSLHGSYASKGGFSKHRNVLSRVERIERLKSVQKWEEGKNSVFNLPKVRNIKSA
jgi:small basic protein (TIGR04137 family)